MLTVYLAGRARRRLKLLTLGLVPLAGGELAVVPSLLAGVVVWLAGCPVSSETALPCRLGGVEIGKPLWRKVEIGYFTYLTFPITVAGLAVLVLAGVMRMTQGQGR